MAANNSSEHAKSTNTVYLDLDTKGLCLMCFTQVKTLDSDNQFASINSFKQFLRYLKINVCELKSIKNSPYSSVDNKNVTLILCQECGTKSKNFTEQHIAWEEMGRKLQLCVEEIRKQVLTTDADPVKVNEYRRQMKGEDKPWNVVLTDNVVVDLRKEAINKCCNGINFGNSQNYTPLSSEQTNSPPTRATIRSSLGSVVNSSSASIQVPQPCRDDSVSIGDFTIPALTAPFIENYVRDNQQPSTSKGLTTSNDPTYQALDQRQVAWMGGNSGSVDYGSDSDLEFDEALHFDQDKDMGEDEPGINSSPVAPDAQMNEVIEEFVGGIDNKDIASPSTRPIRKRRTANRDLPESPLNHDCTVCKKSFPSSRALTVHMKIHNQNKRNDQSPLASKSVSCSICPKVCQNKAAFIQHKRSHTGNNTPARVTLPEDRKGVFKCALCYKSFTEERSRRRHMAARHSWNYLQGILPNGVSKAKLEEAIDREMGSMTTSSEQEENKFPFQCLHCDRSIIGNSDLRTHIVAKHHDKLKFPNKTNYNLPD